MALESTLTDDQKQSLSLDKFIFHIIIADEDTPKYLDFVELTADQKSFFRDRILDVASGTQYVFIDKENSGFVQNTSSILDDVDQNFLPYSKRLASDFCKLHHGSTSSGVFIVAKVTVKVATANVPLIALLKVDHSKVLQYNQTETAEGTRAVMQEIKDSFVEHPQAIQKWAIVDLSSTFAWDVIARERRKSESVADYFESFLGVEPRETNAALTRKAVQKTLIWAKTIPTDDLPEGETPPNYKQRAIRYMELHDKFDTDQFIRVVIKDNDIERKTKHEAELKLFLEQQGVAGQEFDPMPNSLPARQVQNALVTHENVKVVWQGETSANGITIIDNGDNTKKVEILTSSIQYEE